MPSRKENRDAQKLRLSNALIELMGKQDYHDISITGLTEKAGLTRMIFYRNFDTKEQVLACWVARQVEQYREYSALPSGQSHHISHRNIKKAFMMFQENQAIILSCVNAGVGQCIVDALAKYMRSNFTNEFSFGPGSVRRAYVLEAYASALFTTAVKWLRDGSREAPEEMADILYAVYGEHI